VEYQSETLADLPLARIDRLVLHGSIHLTPRSVSLLLAQGVPVCWLSSKGRYRGSLTGAKSKDVFLRIAQVDRSRDESFRSALSSSLIRSKLRGLDSVLRRFSGNHPSKALLEAADAILALVPRCEPLLPVDTLRGFEGQAAAIWFGCFGSMLRNGMPFPGRRRRPPPDPVNATLSYLYTLGLGEASSALMALGLDPAIGLLHQLRYGRESLSLDLLEALRPELDRLALSLFNLRVLTCNHFSSHAEGGVRLTVEGRRRLLEHYERRMGVGGRAGRPLRESVWSLATALRDAIRSGSAGPLEET